MTRCRARDLAREVGADDGRPRLAGKLRRAGAAEVEAEEGPELAERRVTRVPRVERVLVDVLVDGVDVGRALDVEEGGGGEQVGVRPDEGVRVAVDRRLAVGVEAEEVVVVLAPVALDEPVEGEPPAEHGARELELGRRLLAPVERRQRAVAQGGDVDRLRPPVHLDGDALVRLGVDRLHDAPAVEVPLVPHEPARREEREPRPEAGDGPAHRPVRLDVPRRRERVGALEQAAPRRVVAAVGAERDGVLVAPVLRHDVDDAGLGLPVLGVERARDDLDLLDRLVLDLERERLVVHVVDRDAVDEVGHLARPAAAEVALDDAGLEVHDVGEALDRERLELLRRDRGGRVRQVALHDGPLGSDDDLPGLDRRLGELHVEVRRPVNEHADVLDKLRPVPDVGGADLVRPRPDADDGIVAVEVGRGAPVGPDDEDARADERLAGRGVGDAAGHLPGLRGRAGGEREERPEAESHGGAVWEACRRRACGRVGGRAHTPDTRPPSGGCPGRPHHRPPRTGRRPVRYRTTVIVRASAWSGVRSTTR